MHAEAQASGLPFPPLLRRELFDTRGLPEWYCPVRRSRPPAPALLVGGSTLAVVALLVGAASLTHGRRLGVPAQVDAQSVRCGRSATECTATLKLSPSPLLSATALEDLQGQTASLTSITDVANVRARIVAVSAPGVGSRATLHIAWPITQRLPDGELTLRHLEIRSLIGWIAPKSLTRVTWGHAK